MSILFGNDLCGKTFDELDIVTTIFFILGNISDCIVVAYTLFYIYKPSLQQFYITCGIIVNLLLNLLFKEIFRIERPIDSCLKSFAFPSGDVQSITFIGYFLLYDVTAAEMCRRMTWLIAKKLTVVILLITFSFVSRILLHHHTFFQCISGFFIGLFIASIWSVFNKWDTPKKNKYDTTTVIFLFFLFYFFLFFFQFFIFLLFVFFVFLKNIRNNINNVIFVVIIYF